MDVADYEGRATLVQKGLGAYLNLILDSTPVAARTRSRIQYPNVRHNINIVQLGLTLY